MVSPIDVGTITDLHFIFARFGLLAINCLPNAISISKDVGKYTSADLFAVLVASGHCSVGDADVAVEANVQNAICSSQMKRGLGPAVSSII